MVKPHLAVLVCGTLFVAHLSAQEVFNGNAKASPRYPKAEPVKSEAKVEKSVAAAAPKSEASSPHATAVVAKVDNNSAKKIAPVATAKSSKPEKAQPAMATSSSAKPATITKATPTVMPGQRAPAATPSPIVKPEPPLIAKTSKPASAANPKVPSAAVPPPTKVAQAATKPASKPGSVDAHTPSKVEAAKPNKLVAAETHAPVKAAPAPDSHSKVAATEPAKIAKPEAKTPSAAKVAGSTESRPTGAKTAASESHAAVPPPAEGPRHDVVMQVKKPSVPPTKSNKAPAVAKVSAPASKPEAEEEEETTTTSLHGAIKPVPATVVAKKSPPVDAHSIASVPGSLQTRKDAVTKVAYVEKTSAETVVPSPANEHFEMAFTKLADGFDFPVGRPDAQGYYKARGFRSHGHLGEDWDGVGGGDTDLGDPIYCIGDGLVVFARDCHMGWGNVVIVRHSYRDGPAIRTVDSLYGHLLAILVRPGQAVGRGQKIATMGTAHGLYDAHLHLEIRKNIEIGMSRSAFAQDFSNYYDPTQFIQAHRHLQSGGGSYKVAMNTFTRDSRIRWDKVRNYSHAHTGGGQSESAAALKKALATKSQ